MAFDRTGESPGSRRSLHGQGWSGSDQRKPHGTRACRVQESKECDGRVAEAQKEGVREGAQTSFEDRVIRSTGLALGQPQRDVGLAAETGASHERTCQDRDPLRRGARTVQTLGKGAVRPALQRGRARGQSGRLRAEETPRVHDQVSSLGDCLQVSRRAGDHEAAQRGVAGGSYRSGDAGG